MSLALPKHEGSSRGFLFKSSSKGSSVVWGGGVQKLHDIMTLQNKT